MTAKKLKSKDMPSLRSRITSDKFMWHNIVFFFGSIAVAAANYVFYPVLGRIMRVEDFGEVQVLVSLYLEASLFLTAFTIITINVVATKGEEEHKKLLVQELERVATYAVVGALGFTLLFLSQIHNFLKFQSNAPFVILIIALLLSIPVAFRNAYLQGKHDFVGVSIAGIITAITKLMFAALLVVLGLRSFGAIMGIVIAQSMALIYVTRRVRSGGFDNPLNLRRPSWPNISLIKPVLPYTALVVVVTLSVGAFFSADVVLVKHYFSPAAAGIYAGIAAIARILLFATASITAVMFPHVSPDNSVQENHSVLKKSLSLLAVVGLPILGIFSLAPHLVLTVLIGSRYAVQSSLLPRLGTAMVLISLVNMLLYYFLAQRKLFTGAIALIGLSLTAALIYFSHTTIVAIVNNFVYGSIAILVMIIIWSLTGRLARRV